MMWNREESGMMQRNQDEVDSSVMTANRWAWILEGRRNLELEEASFLFWAFDSAGSSRIQQDPARPSKEELESPGGGDGKRRAEFR